MISSDNQDPYQATLHHLTQNNFPYLLMGTYALKLQYPDRMADYAVTDCDLLLPPDPVIVQQFVSTLMAAGWALTLWEEPLTGEEPAETYTGKFYVRAQRESAQLDLTYESPQDWPTAQAAAQTVNGLPVLATDQLLWLKSLKGRPVDRMICDRFAYLPPPS